MNTFFLSLKILIFIELAIFLIKFKHNASDDKPDSQNYDYEMKFNLNQNEHDSKL